MYVKQLTAVTQNELNSVGYKAQDLALLANNNVATAPSIVITSNAFDDTVRQNNLKYKIDYILGHAQLLIESSIVNTYNGCRRAFLEAKFPQGFEAELKEQYEHLTSPARIGELVATNMRPPLRVILSMNRIDDPENNDTIIQNITSFEELLTGVREAWALAYHPSPLRQRLKERFNEARLKAALIVQVMDEPRASAHAYSCLPQDHSRVYLQVYSGYTDLREKVEKDYYALSRRTLHIMMREHHQQTQRLARTETGELIATPTPDLPIEDKANDHMLEELARLAKKSERLILTATKSFFTIHKDTIELLFVNRLGFDVMPSKDEDKIEESIPATDVTPTPTPEATKVPVQEESSLGIEIIPATPTRIMPEEKTIVVDLPEESDTTTTDEESEPTTNDPGDFIGIEELPKDAKENTEDDKKKEKDPTQ